MLAETLGIFLAGIFGGYITGLIGGGGGFIAIPVLIYFGLPPQVAIATTRFGCLGLAASTIYKFNKEKKIVYNYALPLIIISILGSIIGALILVQLNEAILYRIVGVLILLILPFLFFKQEFGLKHRSVSRLTKYFGFLVYFIISIYDGFIGAGAGIFIIYTFVFLLGLTFIEANALDKVAWIFNVIVSLIIFISYGIINYGIGLILMLGFIIGGYWGAHSAIKKGNLFVKIIFVIFVVIFVIKLFFFP